MKKYAFSLDRVLRVRRAQEDAERARLRLAADRARRACEEQEAAHQRYQSATVEAGLRGLASTAMAAREVHVLRAIDVRQTQQQEHEAQAELVDTRESWTGAKQRVSALENLDGRQRAAHEREALAEEQAVTDDIVTSRYRRPK